MFLDIAFEVGSRHIFHRQIMPTIDFIGVKGHYNVRMAEPGGSAHFAQEKCMSSFRTHHLRRQNFQGDHAIHGLVDRLVNSPHAAVAKLVQNAIRPEEKPAIASHQQHGGLEFRDQFPRRQSLGDFTRILNFAELVNDNA